MSVLFQQAFSDSSLCEAKEVLKSAILSTGGIGTTLFYVIGGLLVAGARVLLIVKKRMGSSEK